jgi:hypothetical protein
MSRRKTNADNVPAEYVQCRIAHEWQHEWQPDVEIPSVSWGVIVKKCRHCWTVHVQGFDILGRINYNRYFHPDDYKIDRDLTPTKAELRVRFVKEIR